MNDKIYTAESIKQKKPSEKLPKKLKEARKLENRGFWISRQEVFYKQAKYLEDYEDDYVFNGNSQRHYPTYQSLADDELRGYFSWRTKLRREDYAPAPLTFIYLYIYELLNGIGAETPQEGFEKLLVVLDEYGKFEKEIQDHLGSWLIDYVIYYNLDRSLLPEFDESTDNENLKILSNIQNETPEKVSGAIASLSPNWLKRSKFYSESGKDMDTIIYRVLGHMARHYEKSCKRGLVEQYFGEVNEEPYFLFSGAVFANPIKRENYFYRLDENHVYKCEYGYWSIVSHGVNAASIRKFDKLLKTIDSIMRQEYGYKSQIKTEIKTKWIEKLIRSETRALLEEKSAPKNKPIAIDYSSLARIRQDSEVIRERLAIAEEQPEEDSIADMKPDMESEPVNNDLTPLERRFLDCLINGKSISWVKQEGQILSVLVDGINEKLFDTFGDSVLADGPEVQEDYRESLKEILTE